MEQSPDVGIMQFSSGVMQVVHTYFENGITFFTNLIYTAIRYTVANGDVAPFVGHNAMLRWSAIQQVSYVDEDGYDKFWSESHVSEDFDMSLRLQCNGYIIRLAAWAGDGFKEGVSLTVYDELARWEKYAYGCNELLFHPIRTWLWRGPFTPLFRRFLLSNIRFTSKITVISYIGTYYAIASAWILTALNYFLVGFFKGMLSKFCKSFRLSLSLFLSLSLNILIFSPPPSQDLPSFEVWFSLIVIFSGLGNVALAIMRYRSGENSLVGALIENFKWLPMLVIFLGGLSLHLSQALLSHMFEIDMTWGATAKELDQSNFFLEVPKVLKKVSRVAGQTNSLDLPQDCIERKWVSGRTNQGRRLLVQILHDLLPGLRRPHAHHGPRSLYPPRLAHHRLRRHPPSGLHHRLELAASHRAKPRAHDVFLLKSSYTIYGYIYGP